MIRYEKLDLELSTIACDALVTALAAMNEQPWGYHENAVANMELCDLHNELRARLQHTDPDPHADKNWDLTA